MSNEHDGNGSGNGRARGHNGNGHDFGDEEPTVVIVSRDFLIGSLGRAAAALHAAGDCCLDARGLVTANASSAAIEELIEKLHDLSDITAGMARALENLEFKETP